jgi:hypothetical protein
MSWSRFRSPPADRPAEQATAAIEGLNGLTVAERVVADRIARVAAETSAIGDLFGRIPNLDVHGTENGMEFFVPVSGTHALSFRWTPGVGRGSAASALRILDATALPAVTATPTKP